jgi:hypothetical protein
MATIQDAMEYGGLQPGHMSTYLRILEQYMNSDGTNRSAAPGSAYAPHEISKGGTIDYMALGLGMALGAAYANQMNAQPANKLGMPQTSYAGKTCTCGNCPVHSQNAAGGLEYKVTGIKAADGKSRYNKMPAKGYSHSNIYKA